MTWVLLGLLLVELVLVWQIRRAVGLRVRFRIPGLAPKRIRRPDFRGAIPPNRYVVVRWPDGLHFYEGAYGAKARQMYEHTHPALGEEVELWELGDCRGHKGVE